MQKKYKTLILAGTILLLGLFLWAAVRIGSRVEIANFSTKISARSADQIENLKLALAKIDGTVIKPGEVFSFNETVGERLRQWGYRGAPTIYEGKIIDTPGGGLCQLSSTIYNAALLSGMEIIERKPHLWVINSVGPGRDAAILYDKIDLRFKNNLHHSITVRGELTNSLLIVRFYAPRKLDFKVKVDPQILQVFPAPDLPPNIGGEPDRSIIPTRGKDGVKVKVLRITENLEQQDKENKEGNIDRETTEVVSIDIYKPVPGGKYVDD